MRYDVKGKSYFDSPNKYYCEDIGLGNARIGSVSYTHLDVYKRQGIPSVDAKSFIRSSFGVRTSFSYWAIRTSAQLSGKPTAMPSSFWVR